MERKIDITDEEKDILLKQQHEHYKFIPLLFEIIKECKGHTIDFLNSKKEVKSFGTRYFYSGTINYLKKHLQAIGMLEGRKLINMYRSIAHFRANTIPIFSYNLAERKADSNYVEFDKNYIKYVDGFDLVFDIDSPKKDVVDAISVTKQIKLLLEEAKVPYYLKNSGTRGFHLIIPYNFMPSINPMKLQEIHHKVLYNIAGIYGLKDYIDVSVASHPKTLIKVSYSFDSGNISLPLNDWDFDNFHIDKVKSEYVLKNVYLMNKGLLLRDYGLPEAILKENVQKFLNEYC